MRGGGRRHLGLAACAALGLLGAGCSGGGDGGAADAGPGGGGYPDADTEPCRYGADQPGAKAVYTARLDTIGASTLYVVDLADPGRACAVHEGRDYPVPRWIGDGDGLIVPSDGFVYWIDVSGGLVREPVLVSRGNKVFVSPSSQWLALLRYWPSRSPTQYIAPIGPEGVGEPTAVSDSWSQMRWWAPDADVALVQDTATGELVWVRLDDVGIAEQQVIADLEGGDLSDALWSPDGSKVAVLVTESDAPTRVLLVDAAAATEVHELPVEGGAAGGLAWAPDSQRLAYSVGAAGTYVVDVSTLPPADGVQLSGQWGSWSGPTSLARHTPLTLEITPLTGDGALTSYEVADLSGFDHFMEIWLSPDGRRAVYGAGPEPEFAVQYSELSVPPTAPADLGLSHYRWATWAPDSQSVLMLRSKLASEHDEPTELAVVSFAGAELTWDGHFFPPGFDIFWAPDSASVVLLDGREVGAHRLDPSAAQVTALALPRPPGSVLLDWIWAPVSGGQR